MALSEAQINSVEETIRNSLRRKMETHNPEPAYMPFHTRLLGKDRLALYSFIHSLNTNFGTSIFEPVAASLAGGKFEVQTHIRAGKKISTQARFEIQKIMDSLRVGSANPDKRKEISAIRRVCQQGDIREVRLLGVDVHLTQKNSVYLIDIKTAKPNIGAFEKHKQTLLEWTAATLFENPKAEVHTLIAIPYNPYYPNEYNRWTMKGMLDLDEELKVAEEFWDFLGGAGAYDDLLGCFERVGIELSEEIDGYFAKFNA